MRNEINEEGGALLADLKISRSSTFLMIHSFLTTFSTELMTDDDCGG